VRLPRWRLSSGWNAYRGGEEQEWEGKFSHRLNPSEGHMAARMQGGKSSVCATTGAKHIQMILSSFSSAIRSSL
jgi:hypothetical protein